MNLDCFQEATQTTTNKFSCRFENRLIILKCLNIFEGDAHLFISKGNFEKQHPQEM